MPTFETRVRKEVLNLIIIPADVSNLFRKLGVSNEHFFSDPRYIKCLCDKRVTGKKTIRIPKKTNWVKFERRLESGLDLGVEELEAITRKFTDAMIKVFGEACPKRTSSTRMQLDYIQSGWRKVGVTFIPVKASASNSSIADQLVPPSSYQTERTLLFRAQHAHTKRISTETALHYLSKDRLHEGNIH